VASVSAYWWKVRLIASGIYDLVIDDEEKTITLPIGFGRKQPETMPLASVQGVGIEDRSKKDSDSVQSKHAVVLAIAPMRRETLVEWDESARAERLSCWLRERLGMMATHQRADNGDF